jgi:hypothetical protein
MWIGGAGGILAVVAAEADRLAEKNRLLFGGEALRVLAACALRVALCVPKCRIPELIMALKVANIP